MNRKLNTDNYQYRLTQTHRDDAMRAAENQRLAQSTTEPATRRSLFAGLRKLFRRSMPQQPSSDHHHLRGLRRVLHLMIAAIFTITFLWATAMPSLAQAPTGAHPDPGDAEIYHPALVSFRVGCYYQFKGDQSRAIAEFTEAIELLPNYGYAYAARGDSYVLLGEYQTAIDDYTIAISIYPDYVSALTTRGVAYAALGQYDLALADFDNAITQMPTYAEAYRAAGDIHYLRGEMAEALNYYRSYVYYASEPDSIVTARIEIMQSSS